MDDSMLRDIEESGFGDQSQEAQAPLPEAGGPQVRPVAFQPFSNPLRPTVDGSNIDILMDVTLPLSVQLGTAKMTVREILELGPGSVIELDKAAGEPVDLLVNGKLIARGEVVVIDENFGIRIVEIVNGSDEEPK